MMSGSCTIPFLDELKLYDSIPRRIEAVQMTGGGPTPYQIIKYTFFEFNKYSNYIVQRNYFTYATTHSS